MEQENLKDNSNTNIPGECHSPGRLKNKGMLASISSLSAESMQKDE